ncbi:glutamate decarboxylase [Puccinia sorghi]|uniref:Glutamate decarboxylase n=1 Tax=Puccinia sorghi TaxID=27349 RepID=A0A0L6V4A0_9BASI|nr:glutamate decarboxylase [Puccinia sorghi]
MTVNWSTAVIMRCSRRLTPHDMVMSSREIPKFKLPSKGIEAETAYQLIHDILDLDGRENANLASFVHTWAPVRVYAPVSAAEIFKSSNLTYLTKNNHVDTVIGRIPSNAGMCSFRTATTGSSEAIQLGGLAMKKIWQAKRKAAGKSIHEPGPNIVMGANAQVALEKFARYFDVEARLVPVSEETNYCMDPKKAMEYVDENTIGVFVILGSTYTGHFEPVKPLSDLLDAYEAKTGISVPIHVDGVSFIRKASGAFVAPFVYPELEWDFRLPRVVSINTSGHKFGLTYVGCGWIVWRDHTRLPKELIFELHYLGSVEYSFSLNFSRPAHPIIHQYYNFVQLGFEGFRQVGLGDLSNARLLSRAIERSGYYKVISDIHRKKVDMNKPRGQVPGPSDAKFEEYAMGLPVVAFCWTEEFKKKVGKMSSTPSIKAVMGSNPLRIVFHLSMNYVVPNYELPPDLEKLQILRVVVRESMSPELIDRLFASLIEITESLMKEGGPGGYIDAMPKGKSHEHAFGNHQEGDATKPVRWVLLLPMFLKAQHIHEIACPKFSYARPC